MSALRPVAVVTGGSRGIGAAVCRELAAQGWSVAVGGSSHMEEAEDVAAGIRRRGGNAAAYRADVRDRAALDAMLGDASLRLGPIGALVCCAGVAQQKLFQDITDEDWDRMFDINIKGVYRSIQAALPYLMKRERSRIVTFSSMWGQVGASCESHYAASKGAVIALTQSLAKELGPSGVRVNCVSPGTILTDMTAVLGRKRWMRWRRKPRWSATEARRMRQGLRRSSARRRRISSPGRWLPSTGDISFSARNLTLAKRRGVYYHRDRKG